MIKVTESGEENNEESEIADSYPGPTANLLYLLVESQ